MEFATQSGLQKEAKDRAIVPKESTVNPLAKLLSNSTVVDMLCTKPDWGKDVISLTNADPLDKAISMMARTKITSVPVVNSDTNVMMGFIDLIDVASYIVSACPDRSKLTASNLDELSFLGREISRTPLDHLLTMTRRGGRQPGDTIYQEASALQAAEQLAQGLHRLAVFKPQPGQRPLGRHAESLREAQATGVLCGVCSQSDVNRHAITIADRCTNPPPDLSRMLNTGLSSFDVLRPRLEASGKAPAMQSQLPPLVLEVSAQSSVLDALEKLARTGASAVAVVNEEGKVVGNFSASDLRACFREDPKNRAFHLFLETVADYLRQHSPQALRVTHALPNQPLREVMQVLAEKRLHHLWILSADGRPAGIVTLSDILRIITGHNAPSTQ